MTLRSSRRPSQFVLLLVGSLGTAFSLAGCGDAADSSADPPPPWSHLRITFAGESGGLLEQDGVQLSGDLPGTASVASTQGGRVLVEDVDEDGVESQAARFPDLDPDVGAPAAAVLVRGSDDDELDPGDRDFSFGAEVMLDASSEDDENDSSDNGNNIVQRGLFLDPTQYKLQMDHGLASCRVAGTTGSLVVAATTPVQPGVWYRITCVRRDQTLTMTMDRLDAKGPIRLDQQVATGPTGHVGNGSDSPYLSVGAKVGPDGEIPASASDQLNGLVGAVFLSIDDHDQDDVQDAPLG